MLCARAVNVFGFRSRSCSVYPGEAELEAPAERDPLVRAGFVEPAEPATRCQAFDA